MSYEVYGDGPEPFDTDKLYHRNWNSNADETIWWRYDETETTYSLDEAIEWYNDLMNSDY